MGRLDLRMHEELVLLTLKDDKGTPGASMYTYSLAGAILAELLLEGRVQLQPRRRRKPLVDVASATQTGDPVLDKALRAVHTAKRRAALDTWIRRWARTATLHETARRLSWKGVLRTREKRVLLLFSRTVYPELDPEPERRFIERLRTAIFEDGEADERTAALVSLADAADLLRPVYGRKELRARKKRIAALAETDAAAGAVGATIEAVRRAITAARAAAAT